ncbi:MAG: hypothetical protein U0586_16710, partial [Candidatus Brocadiaceae bacterium]
MKFTMNLLGCLFLLFTQVFFINETVNAEGNGYKNFYGIAWSGKPAEDMKYARQMGYDYIAINPSSTPKVYHNNPNCTGLKFYLIDPYWYPHVLSEYSRTIDTTKPVSDAARDFYNQRMVWKSNDSFPDNLATGYHPNGASTQFSVMWDFQQQAVIDEVVEGIINLARSYEDQGLPFTFGGYIINEPGFAGEFYRLDEKGNNVSASLSYWTGADSGLVHDTITHEYATYSEGRAVFYKQLFRRTREEWPEMKVVMEPYDIYNDWIEAVKDRIDKDELMPDALFQGGASPAFVDNNQIFDSGLIRKGSVGITQPDKQGEYENRLYAALSGMNGAWYNWSGQFGGTGDMPDFQSITKVYPRLKLIRCLPNWDNLNNVPLTERSWDGRVYQSTKSYVSSDIMYSRHPKTGKLFAVFLTLSGVITLNAGERVTSVQCTDGYFIESEDGGADVTIAGNEIRLKSKGNIGKGYIFSISTGGDSLAGSTGSGTNESSGSKASSDMESNNGSSRTKWFSYGTAGGSSHSVTGKGRGNTKTLTTASQQAVSTPINWQSVPLRTKAQQTAGVSGGEGMQMIFAMAYAPTNANIVYAITDTAQIWKSTDGGATWAPQNNGFRSNGGISITVSPYDENVVFIAGGPMPAGGSNYPGSPMGIWRTMDGGNNWELVKTQSYSRGYASSNPITFANATTLYAGMHTGSLFKSTDTGATWSQVNLAAINGDAISNVFAHPDDPTVIFVWSNTDGMLYKITNSGSTITAIGTGLPGNAVSFRIKGNNNGNPNDDIIYAAVGSYGVYKSTNSGSNFTAINNGLPATKNIRDLGMSPNDSNYLYAHSTGSVSLYYSHDGGTTWVQPISSDVKNADGWVCGSQFGKTIDAWFEYYVAPIAPHPTNRDIALASGNGEIIKKTVDGGVNWRWSGTGRTGGAASARALGGELTCFSFDKNNSNRYAVFLADFGPFLTEDNGSTFRNLRVTQYLNASNTNCGAISPTNPNTIITAVGSWDTHRIAITRNANADPPTWTLVSGTDGNYRFIKFHPTNGNIAYAGNKKFTNIQNDNTYVPLAYTVSTMFEGNGNIIYSVVRSPNNSSWTRIYKSTDAGSTWTNPYPDIPYVVDNIGSVVVAPNNQDKIYIAVLCSGVVIVTPSGYTLKNQANGLSLSNLSWNSVDANLLAIDPNNPSIIYCGYWLFFMGPSMGVFRSTDGGNTWININGNLGSNITIMGMTVGPSDGSVYIGTYLGTWRLPPPYGVNNTADTTAPNCSISINSNATYTNSTTVTLALSATDNVGVTGYYLSTSATTPLASASGWTSVTSTTNYTGNVSYTLSSGDGIKTIYAWYKDAVGN